jgi:two-component system sensor histidine kinase KdpD
MARSPDSTERAARILQTAQREERGRLKIFLGAAAGVGKTYAMLLEAQELKRRGVDVVIGYVEAHARPDTIALLKGLETLPHRSVSYRGVEMDEMDLDAILARHPELVLVDELAHTNAPGVQHEKRYQDVEAILANQINVYSTVNVPHLESLNDQVFHLTSTRVRETVPDRLLEIADEVVLVDLPPEELQERLRQGKIYPLGQAQQALTNYFKLRNLVALRELALRETADAVESSYARTVEAPEAETPTAACVLIAVSPRMNDTRLIRQGWRLSRRLRGESQVILVLLHPATKPEQQSAIAAHTRLARALGVPFREVEAANVPQAIASIAEEIHATHIVLGESHRSRWYERLRGSVINEVLRRVSGIDVFVMGDPDRHPAKKERARRQ